MDKFTAGVQYAAGQKAQFHPYIIARPSTELHEKYPIDHYALWISDGTVETLLHSESRVARVLVARRAIERVIGFTHVERLGESVTQMRNTLLECRRQVEIADVQLAYAFA